MVSTKASRTPRGGAGDARAPYARGFPPVSSPDAAVLVLGSLPGEKSIEMQQYYAQARNAFWPIMGELCGAGPALAYAQRLEHLRRARIALWDVLAAGERRGSLDSAIVPSSIVVNDFAAFFAAHPRIEFLSFNGAKAEALFLRHVLPTLAARCAQIKMLRLPSTSPANASYSFERKLGAWSAALSGRVRAATAQRAGGRLRARTNQADRTASRGRPGTGGRRR